MAKYNESVAIEAIKNLHIRGMKKALNFRKEYKNLFKILSEKEALEEIRVNEFYINNNKNQHTKHLFDN